MTRQVGKGKTAPTKILAITLLVVLVCATGGEISAQLASLSGDKGPFFVIIAFEDEVLVTRKGCSTPVEAFIGMELSLGDRLQTGLLGSVELKGDQGERILVESSTSLQIGVGGGMTSRGRTMHLNAGRIWVKVVKLTQALENLFRFSIITPTAFAGVRGTTFRVSVDDDLVTEVSVFDGIVEVIAADTEVKVPAGYSTKVSPGREPEEPNKHSEEQNRAWEKRRQWFEQKPGKLPPPFQEDWQPPGLVGQDKQPDTPGKSKGHPPDKHWPKGKPKAKSESQGPPADKLPPQAQGPKGDGTDG